MSCLIEVTTPKHKRKVFVNIAHIVAFADFAIVVSSDKSSLDVIETSEEIAEKIRRSTHPDAVDHCFSDILRYD